MNKKTKKVKQKTPNVSAIKNIDIYFRIKDVSSIYHNLSDINEIIKNDDNINVKLLVEEGFNHEQISIYNKIQFVQDKDNRLLNSISDSNSELICFAEFGNRVDSLFLTLLLSEINNKKINKNTIKNYRLKTKEKITVTFLEPTVAKYLVSIRQKKNKLIDELNYNLQKLHVFEDEVNELTDKKKLFKYKKSLSNINNPINIFIYFINWFLVIPIKEISNNPHKNYSFLKESSLYRLLFVLLMFTTFFVVPYFSLDAGNSGDEEAWQYPQSEKIINYYKSLGKDKAYADAPANFATYGMSFDTITTSIIKIFNIKNIYEARHIFNSLVGWLTILLLGLLLKKMFDWRAALVVVILMFFSPRFLGHSWNNPKDIPFAMGFAFSLVYMVLYFKEFPNIKLRTIVLLIIGIGLTIGNRVGGILLIAYFGLFSGLFFLFTLKSKSLRHISLVERLKKISINFLIVSLFGYLLGLPLWPYALQNPISKPFEALKILTNYTVSLRQLFSGDVIWSDNVPWQYVPEYFLITTPIIVLLGLIPFIMFWFKEIKTRNSFLYFCVFFSIIFPIFYIIYKNSNVYGGLRHSLFIYPSIVIAASIGIYKILTFQRNKVVNIAILGIAIVLMINPISHTFANHPLQYVYFNQFVGGVKGAYGKYELDYYFHSLKKASNWFIENELPNVEDTIIIATNFNVSYYFREYEDKVKTKYIRYYDRGNSDWDYAIIANTYINPYQLKKDIWPPEITMHTIDVDEMPVCAILKRNNKLDYSGYQKLRKKDYFGAIADLHQAIAKDSTNEVAYINLANAYMFIRRFDQAKKTINQLLEIYPKYDKALNTLGLVYFNERNYEEAFKIFTSITELNPKFVSAYYNLGLLFVQMDKKDDAFKYFQKAIRTNGKYKPPYLAAARILKERGKDKEAQRYIDAANKLK